MSIVFGSMFQSLVLNDRPFLSRTSGDKPIAERNNYIVDL